MKWLKDIEDFKNHIFKNKERASKRHLNSVIVEKPRELFDRACLEISDKLKAIGFQYVPSQHKLKLTSIDKKYTLFIRFSSNRDNVAGQYVELAAFFSIASKDLKNYSKSNPLLNYWDEFLIGRDFCTLINGKGGKVVWNLVDDKDYLSAVNDIPKATKEALIEIFEQLQNKKLVVQEIKNNKFELGNPILTTQYLLMNDEKKMAEKYLSDFLNRPPNKILLDYSKAKKEFKDKGIPNEFIHGKGYGHENALIENQYNLNIIEPNSISNL
jgi:hypothetical protein